MALDARQILAIQVSERTMSLLSLLGSLFIISTFSRWHYFRKPINRLVFYASFGNMMANIATLIATSALPSADSTSISPLCEFQGVLIQWFMAADSLWVFCMALNVLLVFFHGYNSRQLRHLEPYYALLAYGLPSIPGFIYLIIDHVGHRQIIGPATIWCWVAKDVEWMRMAFFYAPIWVIVVSTLAIYIAVGTQIFKNRAALRSFSRRAAADAAMTRSIVGPFSAIQVQTEMKVETEVNLHAVPAGNDSIGHASATNDSRSSFSSTRHLSKSLDIAPVPSPDASRVSWSADPARSPSSPTPHPESNSGNGYRATAFAIASPIGSPNASVHAAPSRAPAHRQSSSKRRGEDGNAAAWGYLKVAFLMFAALFIVWVPSSINRLYPIFHQGSSVFGLSLASSLVLPLQGFWNAMIYTSTSWPECKRAFAETFKIKRERRRSIGKDSDRILTADDNQEFDSAIPLDPRASRGGVVSSFSRLSSAETARPTPT